MGWRGQSQLHSELLPLVVEHGARPAQLLRLVQNLEGFPAYGFLITVRSQFDAHFGPQDSQIEQVGTGASPARRCGLAAQLVHDQTPDRPDLAAAVFQSFGLFPGEPGAANETNAIGQPAESVNGVSALR